MDEDKSTVFREYVGSDAKKILAEILESEQVVSDAVVYPAHIGAFGYFENEADENGIKDITAFDNRSGDCYMEDFYTEEYCKEWLSDKLSADQAHDADDILFQKRVAFKKHELKKEITGLIDKMADGQEGNIFIPVSLTIRNAFSKPSGRRSSDPETWQVNGLLGFQEEGQPGFMLTANSTISPFLTFLSSHLRYQELKDIRWKLANMLNSQQCHTAAIRTVLTDDGQVVRHAVTFSKPFDAEQEAIGHKHHATAVDMEKNTFFFESLKDALAFAGSNAAALSCRGLLQKTVDASGKTKNLVVIETTNQRLAKLVTLDKGQATVSEEGKGTPLLFATFDHLFDATDFKKDITHLEEYAVRSVIDRTIDSHTSTLNVRQQVYIDAYTHQQGISREAVAAAIDRLFTLAAEDTQYKTASKLWKDATREEVEELAYGSFKLLQAEDMNENNGLKR